jgi:uncharacterized protein YutE (UPF0331/DUF86 family)
MAGLDRQTLAEKAAAVERHLQRVTDRLPEQPDDLQAGTDAADVVILNLWQATQTVLDMALGACVRLRLGTPADYADAFQRLAGAGHVERGLASRLVKAAGFRNLVAHRYAHLAMKSVHESALHGPGDLRAFLRAIAAALPA